MNIRQFKPPSGNGHGERELLSNSPDLIAPHSKDSEEAVLGSILINGHLIHDLKVWLKPEHFFLVSHCWIYEAMLSIGHRNEEIDSITLAEELRIRNQLDHVGGVPYLLYLANGTPTFIHYDSYARTIKEAWRRRRMLGLSSDIAQCSLTFDGAESIKAKRLIEEMRELMNEPYDPESDGLIKDLVNVEDLEKLPDVSWLVKGEIPDRGLTIIYGPSGVGKSFLALDYALRLCETHIGLYVAAEGESGFKRRVRAFAYHFHIAPKNLKFFMNVAALLSPADRNAFQSQIVERVKPKFIIFDTLAQNMLPGDENSTKDAGTFMRVAKEIQKEYECAVILVHHTNKEGIQERGNTALRGAADMMIRLVADDDIIAVECTKSKDEKPFPTRYIRLLPVQVDIDDDGNPMYSPVVVDAQKVEQQKTDPATNQQRLILETIADTFELGAPVNELAETLRISRGSLYKALGRMRKLGWVVQEDRGAPHQLTAEGYLTIGRSPSRANDSLSHEFSGLSHPDSLSSDANDSLSHEFSGGEAPQADEKSGESSETSRQRRPEAQNGSETKKATKGDKESLASQRRKQNETKAREAINGGSCPKCELPLTKTSKGNQCPDCGAIWSH